jgi:hypothetical protein
MKFAFEEIEINDPEPKFIFQNIPSDNNESLNTYKSTCNNNSYYFSIYPEKYQPLVSSINC